MTRIDIFSGFLGAGKTTLIKKLIKEAYHGEKLVLIENEFGDIGIDGAFLQESGIQISEINSGCICCSLVGDFGRALQQVIREFSPERILIEPSGVGKLSDVIAAVKKETSETVQLGSFTTVVDATSCDIYMSSFGEFYENQIDTASCIVLSRTDEMTDEEIRDVVAMLRSHNDSATIITTPWDKLTGVQMQEAIEQTQTLALELAALQHEEAHHHHHHHEHEHAHEHHHDHDHEDHNEACGCHHDHDHDHDDDCGCHHPHDHDEHDHDGDCCHHPHHEHADGHECDDPDCGCHHHHHHGHDADEVFTSWGRETTKKFTQDEVKSILVALDDKAQYGMVLRAKGVVEGEDGSWIHFDHVPGEADVRTGCANVTGRVCVIGSKINEAAIAALFGV